MSAVQLMSFEACSHTHTGLNLIQCWYLHMCKGAHYTVIFDLLIDAEKKLMKLLHVNFHLENIRFVFKY